MTPQRAWYLTKLILVMKESITCRKGRWRVLLMCIVHIDKQVDWVGGEGKTGEEP